MKNDVMTYNPDFLVIQTACISTKLWISLSFEDDLNHCLVCVRACGSLDLEVGT